jgi:hypothetical protein
MLIYNHALMTSYFHVVTAKPIPLQAFNSTSAFLSIDLISSPITGEANLRLASHMRLFEGLFVVLDKLSRVPFSFLCYYIFKNYYSSVCVSKYLLNY